MKQRIIAITNHKGGVGKTTTAAAIGSLLAGMGRKTLLIDLDAQANLSSCFIKGEAERTIYNALKEERNLPIMPVRNNLDIIPSGLDMAGAELDLSGKYTRELILKKLLKPFAAEYDYILLDCPPSLGLVTVNALVAAKELFIPLTAEALPSKGLAKLTSIIQMIREGLNKDLTLTGIIITRWEGTKLSRTVEETLRETFGEVVFNTKIRKNVAIAEAPLYTKDIITYAPESNGAKDYKSLAQEIIKQENNSK